MAPAQRTDPQPARDHRCSQRRRLYQRSARRGWQVAPRAAVAVVPAGPGHALVGAGGSPAVVLRTQFESGYVPHRGRTALGRAAYSIGSLRQSDAGLAQQPVPVCLSPQRLARSPGPRQPARQHRGRGRLGTGTGRPAPDAFGPIHLWRGGACHRSGQPAVRQVHCKADVGQGGRIAGGGLRGDCVHLVSRQTRLCLVRRRGGRRNGIAVCRRPTTARARGHPPVPVVAHRGLVADLQRFELAQIRL